MNGYRRFQFVGVLAVVAPTSLVVAAMAARLLYMAGTGRIHSAKMVRIHLEPKGPKPYFYSAKDLLSVLPDNPQRIVYPDERSARKQDVSFADGKRL